MPVTLTVLGLPMTSAGSHRVIGIPEKVETRSQRQIYHIIFRCDSGHLGWMISQLALDPIVSNAEEWTCPKLETPRCCALRIHDDDIYSS